MSIIGHRICSLTAWQVKLSIRYLHHESTLVLKQPAVLFQDNHLLVINKPVGWHSVPNPHPDLSRCLLSELKNRRLGGGSKKDFLLPVHRIDQPCSGVLLFAKTKKAASRLSTHWKNKLVQKEYLCVVPGAHIDGLAGNSSVSADGWYSLQGKISAARK